MTDLKVLTLIALLALLLLLYNNTCTCNARVPFKGLMSKHTQSYLIISALHRLQVVGCMPPPVSSAVILTKAVGGNEVKNTSLYFVYPL